MPRNVLLFLHLVGAIVWIGGMFFAYFCLRPAAGQSLEPPQRLRLWAQSLKRFLRYAAISVVVLLSTGIALMLPRGFHAAPPGWSTMAALGIVMAGVFAYVYGRLYPRLVRHTDAGEWPDAARALASIRLLVALNLALSLFVIAAAVAAR